MGGGIHEKKEKPLYAQLRDAILERFSSLTYYSPLPGERELSEIFGASRPTIRKALDILEGEGKIARMPGKGNFFLGSKAHTDHQLDSTMGFYNDVQHQGKDTKSKVLLQNVEKATEEISEKLHISSGERVFHLERLRYIDGNLYSLTNSFLPMNICPDLLKTDFTEKSLYNTLGEYGIYPYKMHQVLEMKAANFYEALHLEIKEGEPVAVMSSTTSDTEGNIIEFVTTKTQAYKTKYEMIVYREKHEDNKI